MIPVRINECIFTRAQERPKFPHCGLREAVVYVRRIPGVNNLIDEMAWDIPFIPDKSIFSNENRSNHLQLKWLEITVNNRITETQKMINGDIEILIETR